MIADDMAVELRAYAADLAATMPPLTDQQAQAAAEILATTTEGQPCTN